MNQPDAAKRKFTYFESKEVYAALQQEAQLETEKRGRVVTVPELVREVVLKRANKFVTNQGGKPIEFDTSAGKFAPGGISSAVRAEVNVDGRMTVYDRNDNKLKEWKKVQDIPHLLRLYPKCKIQYQTLKSKVA